MKNFLLALVGVAVGAVLAWVLIPVGSGFGLPSGAGFQIHAANGHLGATNVTYSGALSRLETYNILSGFVTDLSATRSPLAGVVTSSTLNLTFPAATSTTATTTAIGLAAAQGDLVLLSPATSTAGIMYLGSVISASTTSATFGIAAVNVSSTVSITPTVTSFQVWVLPAASFKAPAALSVATTSTP